MKLNLNNIFLLDGIGAMISALFTGLLLPVFSERLGIPISLLYGFSILAFIFGAALSVFFLVSQKSKKLLLIIILANCFYCLLSILAMVIIGGITAWGKGLLFAELVVLSIVIVLERYVYRASE